MDKLAKMACVSMDAPIIKTVQDNMFVFKQDVLILAQLEKLVDQIQDAKRETKLNIVLVLKDLQVYLQQSKAVFVSLTNVQAQLVPTITNV